jgi:protein SCO1/2
MGTAVALALLLAGGAEPAARFPAFGMLLEVDREQHRVVVSHGDIPGFMDAMTMPFRVREPKELEGLTAGLLIDFTIVEEEDAIYAEGIRLHHFVSGETQPQNAQRLRLLETLTAGPRAKELAIGDAVPDFTLVDQEKRNVTLADLSGKVVALSFLYTKCRVASYCARLSNNLAVLQERFRDRLGKDLLLITITFDPQNDRPEVLAEYAQRYQADAKTWRFLTGREEDVRRVCHLFGMNFWPDMGMITHTLRTVVLDREGRVAASLEGNEFTPQQLGDLVQAVMNRPDGVRD